MKRISIVFLVLLGSVDAFGKVANLSDAPSVRHQLLLHSERSELTPAVGLTLNDSFSRTFLFQIGYQYHIMEWLSVGAELSYGAAWSTNLTSGIEDQVSADPGFKSDHPGQTYKLPRSSLELLAVAKVSFVPLSGKLVLFNKYLGYADIHIDVGGGMARVKGYSMDPSITFAILVGGGFRFFPTTGVSVNIDVKDYMVRRVVNGSKTDTGTQSLTQNPTLMLGVSVFFPLEAAYGP